MPAHAWILPPKWAPVTFESTCSWRLLRPIPFPSRASHVCALADEAGYGRRRRGALGRRKQDGGRDSARGSGAVLPTELEGTAANPGRSQAAGAAAAAVAAAAASNPHQVVASFIRAIQPGVGSHVGGRNETGSCRAEVLRQSTLQDMTISSDLALRSRRRIWSPSVVHLFFYEAAPPRLASSRLHLERRSDRRASEDEGLRRPLGTNVSRDRGSTIEDRRHRSRYGDAWGGVYRSVGVWLLIPRQGDEALVAGRVDRETEPGGGV